MYLVRFHCFEALFIQITTWFLPHISFQKAIILQMLSLSLKNKPRWETHAADFHKRQHGYWTLLSVWWLRKFLFCSWKLPTCHQPFNCSFMWQKESWEYFCDQIMMKQSLHACFFRRDGERGLYTYGFKSPECTTFFYAFFSTFKLLIVQTVK